MLEDNNNALLKENLSLKEDVKKLEEVEKELVTLRNANKDLTAKCSKLTLDLLSTENKFKKKKK